MTEERPMRRLRTANPVAVANAPAGAGELLARIVSEPGDPRLLAGRRRLAPWLIGPRRLVLVAVAFLLVAAGGTAGVVGSGVFAHDHPVALFRHDPVGRGLPPGASLWHQTVITSTVHRAETFTVPGVGRIAFWVAASRQHGRCTALRLPGGSWSGLDGSSLDAGGTVPGCAPTRAQVDRSQPPVYLLDGFDYQEAIVRGHDGRQWRIEYGHVNARGGRPAIVRDTLSGITARVARGGWFAIVFPISGANALPAWRLQALDGQGRIVAHEPHAG
jgi:hypothetical protein